MASRISAQPSQGTRLDVVQVARRCGLSLLYIPSMRNGVEKGVEPREDRGSAINGDHIDVFFKRHKDALAWGRQRLVVRVYPATKVASAR